MSTRWFAVPLSALALVALLLANQSGAVAQGPVSPHQSEAVQGNTNADQVFTYQGLLKSSGSPYNGTCDFQFRLYQSESGSDLAAGPLTDSGVAVSNGLFSAPIAQANWGPQRWLEISVRCPAGSGNYVTLTPREKITAAPYANSLRPGAQIAAVDDAGNTVGQVFIADFTYAMIDAWSFYTRTPALLGNAVGNTDATGVVGHATKYGLANHNYGVMGLASRGSESALAARPVASYDAGGAFAGPNGVIGLASAEDSTDGYGVVGITTGTSGAGVYGYASAATGGTGVYGSATGIGSHAVEGYADTTGGWAGFFTSNAGGVRISAPAGYSGLTVIGGTKSAVVPTGSGARQLYTEESTQVWFSDYGFGKLDKGAAVVPIDPLFAQTVSLTEPYHVFVQSYGDADLYVTNRTAASFEVRLHGSGDAAVEFSYRVVALRKGYETARLAAAPWADDDPNLYPGKQPSAAPKLQQQVQNGPAAATPAFTEPAQRQSPGAH
jgi:hypothetical protein